MRRPSRRAHNELRTLTFTRSFTHLAEGSVLVSMGNTKIICNASITDTLPRFLKNSNQGWLTAEYGMLPRATQERADREAVRGKQTGRTIEIQRIIGRSLRAALDLKKFYPYTMHIDCDVIQADGSTRTTAINGAFIAMVDALQTLQRKNILKTDPLKHYVAAVSVGVYRNTPILDLDYQEDAAADTDMNIVMTDDLRFVEIQGTAERSCFDSRALHKLTELAREGIQHIIQQQKTILAQG